MIFLLMFYQIQQWGQVGAVLKIHAVSYISPPNQKVFGLIMTTICLATIRF